MTAITTRRLGLRLALAACLLGGNLAITTEADARPGRGWAKRTASSSADSTKTRKGLFARVAERRKAAVRTSAAPRPAAAPRSVAIAIPSAPKPRAAASTPKPSSKRTGLLARIFAPDDDLKPAASQPAARRSAPPKPQLAPGQPNANQSAPKINHGLIAKSSKSASSVTINIARQRAYVYIGGQVAVDTPVSTARTGKYTPRGSFRIGERIHSGKISNLYHVEMPRWMRLGSSPYGMHAGYLPGYPASAGCIRMPFSAADAVYKATGYGTRVKIM